MSIELPTGNLGKIIAATRDFKLVIGHQVMNLAPNQYPPVFYQVIDKYGVVSVEGPQLPAGIRALHAMQEFYDSVMEDPSGERIKAQLAGTDINDPFAGPGGRA